MKAAKRGTKAAQERAIIKENVMESKAIIEVLRKSAGTLERMTEMYELGGLSEKEMKGGFLFFRLLLTY